ncbi:MAG: methyl-accepting chemotaxis protein [Leptospirales bacterium]|nr:methyl-accepting chemotaxis protein [Leptospirales bacterium]
MVSWFKNLSLAKKILLSCSCLILFTLAVCVQSYITIKQAQSDSGAINDSLDNIGQLDSVMKGLLQVRINMLQEDILSRAGMKGEAGREFEKRVEHSAKLHEANEKALGELAGRLTSATDKALLNSFTESYKNLRRIGKDYLAQLRAEKNEEAEVISRQWLKEYQDAQQTMEKLLEAQHKHSEEILAAEERNALRAEIILGILLVFAVAFGILATLILTRAISAQLQRVVAVANQMEGGDLSGEIAVDRKDETGKLGVALNSSLSALNEILTETAATVEQVASGTQQIASASESLSQGATEQASALEEITSSITELSAQTKQAAANAESANAIAKQVMGYASEGNQKMLEMVGAMDDINKASASISKIMKAIDEIAFQTNLLALNAAVEAARAGKYGKGFAVVAEEVRNLATRSAGSAKETSEIIEVSINKIQAGTQMAQASLKAFQEIVEGINQTVRLVGEISTSATEQVRGIVQVESALQQIDVVTQQNAANAEETAAAGTQLAGQSGMLRKMISKFKLKAGSATHKAEGKKSLFVHGESRNGHHENGHSTNGSSNGVKTAAPVAHGHAQNGNGTAPGRVSPASVISLEDDDFRGI